MALISISGRDDYGHSAVLAAWRKGLSNLLETVYLPAGEAATTLVRFIEQNRLTVRYPMPDGTTGQARFSLRGSSGHFGRFSSTWSPGGAPVRQNTVRALTPLPISSGLYRWALR